MNNGWASPIPLLFCPFRANLNDLGFDKFLDFSIINIPIQSALLHKFIVEQLLYFLFQ